MENLPTTYKISVLYSFLKQTWIIMLLLIICLLKITFPIYFFGPLYFLAIGLMVFLGLKAFYSIIYDRTKEFILFEDRLVVKEGIFFRTNDFIELYRIKDYSSYQTLFMQMLSLMAVTIYSSDKTSPELQIKGIKSSGVLERLRLLVEEQRRIKGVREFD